ncbi:MAG: hypothetical protein AVDCRST_MAG77-908 [uncultured Chloroflexi bacterium]|uniref:Uncharacterized protein n=1 Tax=uncultured Chloroflexota bacterium TaxID=166587 RepID=A0A6J4HPC3_9CHLR|nr:MAG: hypothetical protein AVDCRST_MAG77-908 [uncultured Chloroflexota bacterium]
MATRALDKADGLTEQLTDLRGDVGQAGSAAARSPWVERLARLGYLVRGLLYATMGILAI